MEKVDCAHGVDEFLARRGGGGEENGDESEHLWWGVTRQSHPAREEGERGRTREQSKPGSAILGSSRAAWGGAGRVRRGGRSGEMGRTHAHGEVSQLLFCGSGHG